MRFYTLNSSRQFLTRTSKPWASAGMENEDLPLPGNWD